MHFQVPIGTIEPFTFELERVLEEREASRTPNENGEFTFDLLTSYFASGFVEACQIVFRKIFFHGRNMCLTVDDARIRLFCQPRKTPQEIVCVTT